MTACAYALETSIPGRLPIARRSRECSQAPDGVDDAFLAKAHQHLAGGRSGYAELLNDQVFAGDGFVDYVSAVTNAILDHISYLYPFRLVCAPRYRHKITVDISCRPGIPALNSTGQLTIRDVHTS